MGSMDIIKPLSTVLSSVIDKSNQHQDKVNKFRESNPGQLGEKRERYLCAMFPSKEALKLFKPD